MKRPLSFPIFFFLAATALAPVGATRIPQNSPNASIPFARANVNPQTGQTPQSPLCCINLPGGTIALLAPQTEGFRYDEGRWSTGGGRIVYSHCTSSGYSQLFIVNRQGGSERRIAGL